MFIGRNQELEHLNSLYQSEGFEFVVMYGRRRVGKTTLLNEFMKDKNSAYYMATKENASANLASLSVAISDQEGLSYESFDKALQAVNEKGKEERFLLVIDEFPYLAESAPEISSLIQRAIDHSFLSSKVMLILCGSSMSFMEHQVLGYQSPLYGRRTSQMKIQPFSFFECRAFFPEMGNEELMGIYGITGGIPQYLAFMDGKKGLKENINNNFLRTTAPLYEEPSNLLLQELRNPSNYNAILYAIAHGASRLKEISDSAKLTSAQTSNLMENLMELGIVEKKTPVSPNKVNSRKTIYQIADTMFRFWYRFVGRHQSQIERGRGASVYQKVEQELNDFLGPIFEGVCIGWMWDNIDDDFQDLGAWWGTDKTERREVEIDILGFSSDKKALFIGECKWRNQLLDTDVLKKLLENSKLFAVNQKNYFLFSKSGFTEKCIQMAAEKEVKLIKFEEMV